MNKRKLFGTDGIRGKSNLYPMISEVAIKVGRGVACLYKDKNVAREHRIVIGKDTRRSGYMFENALTAGILAENVDVLLTGPVPTPAIAYLTKALNCDAGIMISASHNPAEDNGIKIFSYKGYKLKDYREEQIENTVFSDYCEAESKRNMVGKAKRIEDASGRYIEFLKHTINYNSLEGLRVVLDCANGAAYKIAPQLFTELKADVIPINVSPDGYNINKDCGALHPEAMQKAVLEHKADLGIALDGDADRLIVCDDKGNILDGDYLMAIFAIELKKQKKLKKDTIVSTVMSNYGLDECMKKHKIKIVKADVGDRFVIEKLRSDGYSFGGEQSGHIIFAEHSTTGDGLLSALQLCNILVQQKKKMSELAKILHKYPQILINIKVKEKIPLDKIPEFVSEKRKSERLLRNKGRLLVRYSGTENICRVMVEGKDDCKIKEIASVLVNAISKEIGA
ncbi:MAG: phosphoglucosamine mutase [archaeon]